MIGVRAGSHARIALLLVLAASVVVLPRCEPPDPPSDAELRDGTEVPEQNARLRSAFVDTVANTVRLVYEPGAQLPSYEQGTVLIGALNGGYLVKVRSVEQRADTLLVNSEPACLVDAFAELHIDTSFHLMPEARSYGPGRHQSLAEATDGRALTLEISWGALRVEPVNDLAFEVRLTGVRCDVKDDDQTLVGWVVVDDVVYYKSINVKPYVDIDVVEGLREFRFIVSATDSVKFLGAEAQLTVNVDVADDAEFCSVPLGTVPLPIPIPPGAIPIEFQFRLLGGYEFNFLLEAATRLDTDLRAGMTLQLGAVYRKGEGWTPYWNQECGGSAGLSLTGGVTLDASFEAWLRGSLEAYVCHLAGPNVWVRPYQYEEVSTPPLDYDMGVGVEAGLGFRVKFLTFELADYDRTLDDKRWSLAQPSENHPPATPYAPSGPGGGQVGTSYDFSAVTTDPDGDQIQYQFDWGNGVQSNWTGLISSGSQVQETYAWQTAGTYGVKVRARDEHGLATDWSAGHEVVIVPGASQPPNTPSTPAGPTQGQVNTAYEFTASTTDPEGDQIQYQFDWGNGVQSVWTGLVPSGTPVQQSYAWPVAGDYSVKVWARDAHGGTSSWSDPHQIVISGPPPGYPNRVVRTVSVGNGPDGIAVLPNGGYVYVANAYDASVSILRTGDDVVESTVAVASGPDCIAALPDGLYVYVTSDGSPSVTVIRVSDQTVYLTVPLGPEPHGVAALPIGEFAYVARNVGELSVIRTTDHSIVGAVDVDGQPHGVVSLPSGDYVYVTNCPNGSAVSAVRTSDNTVQATIDVGGYPFRAAVLGSGQYVYVANAVSNDVSVIRTLDNTVVATVQVGSNPSGVAVLPGDEYVYVANCVDNSVSVIRTSDNTVMETIPVGAGPNDIVALPDGSKVYVTNNGDDSVTVLGR